MTTAIDDGTITPEDVRVCFTGAIDWQKIRAATRGR